MEILTRMEEGMGILSGLKGLGLGNLEGMSLFEEPKKKEDQKKESVAVAQKPEEKDLIYDRSFTCPVCDSSFTAKMMKSNKARLIATDQDLRAKYDGIDAVKYDIVMCTVCGYAALLRYFTNVTPTQAKLIKEKISQTVRIPQYNKEIYSYEEALQRYQLALVNSVIKRSKPSEKAYICLKNAWLFRGYAESLKEKEEPDEKMIEDLNAKEEELLENAYKGFSEARQTEVFPMCGMNEITVDYLLAVLALRFKDFDVAGRYVSAILTSSAANARIKDKARDMKEQIVQEQKKAAKAAGG